MYDIRPVELADAESLTQLFIQLPTETQFMMLEPGERTLTVAQQQDQLTALTTATDKQMMVAVQTDADQVVGFIVASRGAFNRNRHRFDIVMGLLKAHWRQGLGQRLLTEIEAWVLAQSGRRMELTVRCANCAAIQLYQRCGFAIEGRRIGSLCVNGTYVDEYSMGKWLSPTETPQGNVPTISEPPEIELTGLNHLTIVVSDLDRSLVFYSEHLSFTPLVRWQRGAYLQLGALWLCLTLGQPGKSTDYGHIAFSVRPEHFAVIAERLRAAQVPEWQEDSSEGASIYINDPDGHRLEVHRGDLCSRLASLRTTPYEGLIWLHR